MRICRRSSRNEGQTPATPLNVQTGNALISTATLACTTFQVKSAFLGAARLLQLLCALATTLSLSLNAAGPTGGHRCVRGHRWMALILLSAEGFGLVDFPRGLAPDAEPFGRVSFVARLKARTHAELRSDGVPRTPTTVRPPLILADWNQCGLGWGGDGEICLDRCPARGVAGSRAWSREPQCASEARAFWERALHCIRKLSSAETGVAMRQRSARILRACSALHSGGSSLLSE